MHTMRWPWERRQEVANVSLNEVVRQLDRSVKVLRAEVARLRAERDRGSGAGGAERPS